MKTETLFSSTREEWETPQELFDRYDSAYHFTLDAASTHENAKCRKHYTKKEDGLSRPWTGETDWLNPPYGRGIDRWLHKAKEESRSADTTVVCLLPVRTDTAWFHEYCLDEKIEFLRGRLRFGGSSNNAPFPSMIVTFGEAGQET